MKKRLLILCLSLIGLPMQAGAVSLSFSPTSGSVEIGDTISLDIIVGDLGNAGPVSLGAFDLNILYDDSKLNFESVNYGSLLGDIDPFAFETDIFTNLSAGSLGLSELSFLLDTELDTLQSASFTLATLEFSGLVTGGSALSFDSVNLSDAFGSSLAGVGTSVANITVTPNTVDEPSTLFLMLSSLLSITYLRKKTMLS